MKDRLPSEDALPQQLRDTPGLLPREQGGVSITDIQFDALSAGVARGESALVSAPTSTGKTLIAWWAIGSAIAAGGRTVYLVSHRALAKQKFEEAQRLFLNSFLEGDRSTLVCATGDAVEDAFGRRTSNPLAATLLVATYEKFLGCLSTGGPPRDLTDITFVCDEIQLIGDKSRGQNVELLLTLLKKAGWQQFVGLSAVLSERDAGSLADWLGLRLVRNPTREKTLRIQCRAPTQLYEVIAAPNRDGAVTSLPERKAQDTNAIVAELHAEPARRPTIVFCMKIDDTYSLAQSWIAGKQATRKVALPQGVDIDPGLLRSLERGAAYHNAELSEDERLFVEDRISQGKVDVVYATSTLAAGVNFPFGSAVFSSWKRWNGDKKTYVPIERAEFQNMAGRVGRMGQAADEGLVVMCAEGGASTTPALALMNLHLQDELGQGIKPDDFGALALQLFAGKLCHSRQDAFDLLTSTLSASREAAANSAGVQHWLPKLNAQIDRLKEAGCIIESGSNITVTTFGLAVARTGLKPETVIFMIQGLLKHGTSLGALISDGCNPAAEDDLLFVLSHAALSSAEFTYTGGKPTRSIQWRVSKHHLVSNEYARRLKHLLFEGPWEANVGAANGALLVASWAAGQDRRGLEKIVGAVRIGTIQSLAQDVAWILTGVAEVVASVTSPTMADESKPGPLRGDGPDVQALRQLARGLRRQAARTATGLPTEVLWMTGLDMQGRPRRLSRVQILALRKQGLTRPVDLMNGDPTTDTARRIALQAEEDPRLANAVRDAAKRWKIDDREYCRKAHLKRASVLGAADVIDALYLARGDAFEDAFEGALGLVAIQFERIDKRGVPAYPDHLVTIESFPTLVVELKTKVSAAETVPLNAATEVLTASELIGMKDSFCVTVCSPGVEPSVPGVIERCGRLCVVDVCDLAEALLRLREGRLDRDELYNWLTTPGIALMEDLPQPH